MEKKNTGTIAFRFRQVLLYYDHRNVLNEGILTEGKADTLDTNMPVDMTELKCNKTVTGNFFIITNLIHKFLVHSHKLHKIKFLYMFRAQHR